MQAQTSDTTLQRNNVTVITAELNRYDPHFILIDCPEANRNRDASCHLHECMANDGFHSLGTIQRPESCPQQYPFGHQPHEAQRDENGMP